MIAMLANPGEEKLFRKQYGYLDFGNAEVLQVPILNPIFLQSLRRFLRSLRFKILNYKIRAFVPYLNCSVNSETCRLSS